MSEKKRAAIAVLLLLKDEKEDKISKRKVNRIWVKNIYKRRREKGSYENLVTELALEDSENYRRFLRMDTTTFMDIVEELKPHIESRTPRPDRISAGEKVALTLRYLATGDSYQSLKFAFRVSPQSLSNIIPQVCDAIYSVYREKFLKIPSTENEWEKIGKQFFELWNFPNCIGALDGKHVNIIPPPESGSHYYNYKGHHSIVLMAMADADMKFVFVDIGKNGRASDGGIWAECALRKAIEENTLSIPAPVEVNRHTLPYVIVGDDAFPLKTYLMKPFSCQKLNNERRIFNYRLSRARRIIENAFGLLTTIWRIYQKPIQLTKVNAEKVVLATIVLHNLLRMKKSTRNMYSPINDLDREDTETGDVILGNWRRMNSGLGTERIGQIGSNTYQNEAKQIRDQYCDYFNTDGQVSWQLNYIKK